MKEEVKKQRGVHKSSFLWVIVEDLFWKEMKISFWFQPLVIIRRQEEPEENKALLPENSQ